MINISLDSRASDFPVHLQQASDFLKDHADHPIKLQLIARQWDLDEFYFGAEDALQRIDEFARYTQRPANVRDIPYKVRAVDPTHGSGMIAEIAQELDRHQGILNSAIFGLLCRLRLLERTILLLPNEQTGDLEYLYIGSEIGARLGKKWQRAAIGKTIESAPQHDSNYDRWVKTKYIKVFNGNTLERHHVDAIITPERRNLPYRVNYDRLIARCRLTNGRPALITVSAIYPALLSLVQGDSAKQSGSHSEPTDSLAKRVSNLVLLN